MRLTALCTALFLVSACTPQDSGDAGFDAGLGSDAGADAGLDAGSDDGCPVYDGGDSWCLGRLRRCHRCDATQLAQCDRDNIQFCEHDGSNYSPEWLAVLGQCEDSHACMSNGSDFTTCVQAARDVMVLNAARTALANAYCAKCDASNTMCAETFFDTASTDRGAFLSELKNPVINAVKQYCVDASSVDCGLFLPCAASYLPDELTRTDFCKVDGGM